MDAPACEGDTVCDGFPANGQKKNGSDAGATRCPCILWESGDSNLSHSLTHICLLTSPTLENRQDANPYAQGSYWGLDIDEGPGA